MKDPRVLIIIALIAKLDQQFCYHSVENKWMSGLKEAILTYFKEYKE